MPPTRRIKILTAHNFFEGSCAHTLTDCGGTWRNVAFSKFSAVASCAQKIFSAFITPSKPCDSLLPQDALAGPSAPFPRPSE
jgi:hypothetical protein